VPGFPGSVVLVAVGLVIDFTARLVPYCARYAASISASFESSPVKTRY
jgi:hypothetical protein